MRRCLWRAGSDVDLERAHNSKVIGSNPTPATRVATVAQKMWLPNQRGLSNGDQGMKQVFVARTPTEAHLVKGVLETRGISAEVRGEALWGTRGEIPLTPDTLPTVWVLHDLQAPEAVRIVEEYSSSAPASGGEAEGWRCPACGEQVEPQFSECWKCGASRPA